MKNIQSELLELLERCDNPINIADLLQNYLNTWQELLHVELTELWKQGKVYSSQVEWREGAGYLPATKANWVAEATNDYFGYSDRLGVFRCRSDSSSISRVTLQATLYLDNPYCVSIAPNGDEFAVGDEDGVIWIGSIQKAAFVDKFQGHDSKVWTIDHSPDGTSFVSGSENGHISLWSKGWNNRSICENTRPVMSVSFSPDGRYILSGHRAEKDIQGMYKSRIFRWLVEDPSKFESFPHHDFTVNAVCYHPDGSGFAAGGRANDGSNNGRVTYWSFSDELKFAAEKHAGIVRSLKVNGDGQHLVSGAWNGIVRIWDLDGNTLQAIEAHSGLVTSVDTSPSGKYLSSAGKDNNIAIWSIPQGKLLQSVVAHQSWVRAVSFGKDDHTLISVGSDGLCKIWRLE